MDIKEPDGVDFVINSRPLTKKKKLQSAITFVLQSKTLPQKALTERTARITRKKVVA